MKQFIRLFTGRCKFDNSMSRNTPRFWEDEFPLAIRPHLVESIRHIRHGDKVLSEVALAGYEFPVYCLNDADEIIKQISDIEINCTGQNTGKEITDANT